MAERLVVDITNVQLCVLRTTFHSNYVLGNLIVPFYANHADCHV
jgi:hypothetical protein